MSTRTRASAAGPLVTFRSGISWSPSGPVARRGVSDLMTLQELAPDHHALDLGRALADQQQRRVAVDALDLVLLGVAVAAVDPQALLGAEPAGLRREQLGH